MSKHKGNIPDVILGTGELAAKIGVDPRTLQRWVHDGMPSDGRGKFSIDSLIWIIQNYKTRLDEKPKEQKDLEAQHREVKIEIDKEKLAVIRGENTPNYMIAEVLSELGFIIKSRLRGLKRLAGKLDGMTVVEMATELDRFSASIMKELSETQVKFAEEDDKK